MPLNNELYRMQKETAMPYFKILSRVSVRSRGIRLTIGFIAPYNQLQLSLSGLPQSYNSRLNISQQLRSHRNRCNPGNRRTPGSLPSVNTNSHARQLKLSNNFLLLRRLLQTLFSEDCRGDSAFGIGCLAIT
jgi:hypothetical protein